jgi:hypothetical protein
MNTTTYPTSATARAPMTDAPEVLDAIDQTTDHPAGRPRPRRPATTPGRGLRPLHIGGVEIAQDEHGRYSLNDMHRAAMAAGSATESQRPGEFLRSAGVQAFLSALDGSGLTAGIHAVKTEEGRYGGTYGARLVVLRYAAWIAPTFEVQVYQCFDDMTRGKAPGYRLDDRTRRVRDVFNTAGASTKAQGLRGAARLEGVAPDLLHLVVTPAPAPVAPTPAPAADLLGDHARRVREVFQLVEQTANARGLRGKARDEVARAVVQEIAPDLLHLVAMPAPAAPVTPPPAPVADLPTLFGKPKEGADLLLNVADWFRKNAKTGFLLWALDEFNPKNAGRVAGWVRPTASGSEVFYILVDAFRHEACKGIDYRAALRALEAEGLTIREGQPPRRGEPDARRFDAKARPPLYAPGSARVYRIKGEVLNLTA